MNIGKATQIEEVDYLSLDLEQYPVLPWEEMKEKFHLAQAGDSEARELLIASNMGLVMKMAIKLANSIKRPEWQDDLVAQGVLGLITAVDKFDLNRGCQFSTYATAWITRYLYEGIRDLRTIALPREKVWDFLFLLRTQESVSKLLQRQPSVIELAEATSFTPEYVRELQTLIAMTDVSSLDTPLNSEEEEETIGDLIVDATAEEVPLKAAAEDRVENGLRFLTERQQAIIRLRYGLGCPKHTLEQTADVLHRRGLSKTRVSRERVRQWQETAEERLARKCKLPQKKKGKEAKV